jgi:hypothetical protein
VLVLNSSFCGFTSRFEPADPSGRPRVEIDSDSREIVLTGSDEGAMKQLFLKMCDEGGISVGTNTPVEIESDENEIMVELENGVATKIAAPAPLFFRTIVRDTCDNQATKIMRVTPE